MRNKKIIQILENLCTIVNIFLAGVKLKARKGDIGAHS